MTDSHHGNHMRAAALVATASAMASMAGYGSRHSYVSNFEKTTMKGLPGECKHTPKNRKARLAKKRKELARAKCIANNKTTDNNCYHDDFDGDLLSVYPLKEKRIGK